MNKQQTAIGLDIGTSRLVAATQKGSECVFQAQLNAFLTLPYSKLTHSALKKDNVPHEIKGDEVVIFGNESERFANLFLRETRRPMTRGLLNPQETAAISAISHLVGTLIGTESGNGRRLCVSIPGASAESQTDLTYHEATVRRMLSDLGFQVSTINEGLAVILAELEDTNFTGIGISWGGGMCNVCLAYLAMPVFSFSVPKAGDYIDASAASVAAEGATQVRAVKEQSFHFNGFFADKIHQAISVYYEDVIVSVVKALKDYLAKTRNVPRLDRPIPIVVSGGSALPDGFRERFEKLLEPAGLPIKISEVRIAPDPLHSTAKGALVSALAEI